MECWSDAVEQRPERGRVRTARNCFPPTPQRHPHAPKRTSRDITGNCWASMGDLRQPGRGQFVAPRARPPGLQPSTKFFASRAINQRPMADAVIFRARPGRAPAAARQAQQSTAHDRRVTELPHAHAVPAASCKAGRGSSTKSRQLCRRGAVKQPAEPKPQDTASGDAPTHAPAGATTATAPRLRGRVCSPGRHPGTATTTRWPRKWPPKRPRKRTQERPQKWARKRGLESGP